MTNTFLQRLKSLFSMFKYDFATNEEKKASSQNRIAHCTNVKRAHLDRIEQQQRFLWKQKGFCKERLGRHENIDDVLFEANANKKAGIGRRSDDSRCAEVIRGSLSLSPDR